MPSMTETLARRAVEKTSADRQARYAKEMGRIIEATYEYVERTGNLRAVAAGDPRPLWPLHPGFLPVLPLEGRAHDGVARRRSAPAR